MNPLLSILSLNHRRWRGLSTAFPYCTEQFLFNIYIGKGKHKLHRDPPCLSGQGGSVTLHWCNIPAAV